MDIRDLRCFLYASETLNFTRTAQRMYMSQQGVSRIIGKLEEELQVPLFYRRSQGLVLSEYGQQFVTTARNILAELEQYKMFVEQGREEKRFALRLAIPSGMLHMFPVEPVSEFMRQYPDVDLYIREYKDFQCENAVLDGEADLALCVRVEDPDLRIHHVHTEKTYFMISEKNPLSEHDELGFLDVKDESFLAIEESNISGGRFLRSCLEHGFEPKTVFCSSDIQLLQKMCAENIGIGFYVGPFPAEFPGVKIVKIKGEEIEWNAYLVSAVSRELNGIEKAFITQIRNKWI